MNNQNNPPPLLTTRPAKPAKGFLPPRAVRAVSFYVMAACVAASVVTCILAIWDFTKGDALWRLVASFLVVAAGTGLFNAVNASFGEEKPE